MYIPKNKTKTNLFTAGGEFVFRANNKPYKGKYWKDFRGKFYSGVDPNDTPTFEIIPPPPIENNTPSPDNTEVMKTIENNINMEGPFIANLNYNYSNIKGGGENEILVPQAYYPILTESDYQTTEFQRYFCKKTNERKYIELDKKTYEKLDSKNDKYLWQLYITFSIPWNIKGERLRTWMVNKNMSILKTKRLKLSGFVQYLKFDFLKYYRYTPQNNLYTGGNFLVTPQGVNYIGYYHVNSEMGPMEGKTHASTSHNRLFYLNTLGERIRYLSPKLKDAYYKMKKINPSSNGGRSSY